jgi:hypothetical protein
MVAAALMAGVAGACEDTTEPREVTLQDITRTYTAVQLTVTTANGTTTDWLATGADLDLTLRADGTTTGRLFAPGADEDGGDFEASLEGRFSFDDETDEIVLDHDADTFLLDMTFVAVATETGTELQAERTFSGSGETIRVRLR